MRWLSASASASNRVRLGVVDLARASVQEEGDPNQLRGFGEGKEKAVILFPPTCISRIL